jgi:hypothetical protein
MALKAIAFLVMTFITMFEVHAAVYYAFLAKGPAREKLRRWALNSLLVHEFATFRGSHPTVWRVWPQLGLGAFVFAMAKQTHPTGWALSLGLSCFAVAFISTSARAFFMNVHKLRPWHNLQT